MRKNNFLFLLADPCWSTINICSESIGFIYSARVFTISGIRNNYLRTLLHPINKRLIKELVGAQKHHLSKGSHIFPYYVQVLCDSLAILIRSILDKLSESCNSNAITQIGKMRFTQSSGRNNKSI